MTLNKIMSGFDKTIRQLENLVSRNASLIAGNDKAIDNFMDSVDEMHVDTQRLSTESEKAQGVADNIKVLIGQPV